MTTNLVFEIIFCPMRWQQCSNFADKHLKKLNMFILVNQSFIQVALLAG